VLFNFNPLVRQLKKLEKDVQNPNGKLTEILRESTRNTALYLADLTLTLGTFNNRSSRIYEAIKSSWKIDRISNQYYITDTDEMDRLVGKYRVSTDQHTIRKYSYNIPELNFNGQITSYWYFILMGWGKEGGFGEKYDWIATVKDASGKVFRTSPFNRGIGADLKLLKMQKHPGHAGKNWYKVFNENYNNFFLQDFNKRAITYVRNFIY